MAQRSTPQQVIDDRAYPVRLYILVPPDGFGRLYGAEMDAIPAWLDREVGRGRYALHNGGRVAVGSGLRERVAAYFQHPLAAVRFLETFPQLEIADGTAAITYSSPLHPAIPR